MASSDIFSGDQGGSHVSSTSTSSTSGIARAISVDVLLDHRADWTAHRRQGVDHLHLRALDLDVVEEAQLDDVHPELGILDRTERVEYLFFCRHGASLAPRPVMPPSFWVAA